MTHITDYGGAIDDYYPARMERIKDMELTELEKQADIEAEESRMKPEVLDGGWQPIETAPEYREVLVLRRDKEVVIASIAHTPSGYIGRANYDFGHVSGTIYFPISGKQDADDAPTHWMPLPKAPS